VVQLEVVSDLAVALGEGGQVLIQSDVLEVAAEMCDRFDANPMFQRAQPDWLAENPLPVATEREISTLKQGLPVYRMLFAKKSLSA
jgi:tRNA (guanine-N7-)-methyltransferase